jgi:hypothetical protein
MIKITDSNMGSNVRISYGGTIIEDNSSLNYVGGKIHELYDKIESNTGSGRLTHILPLRNGN